MSSWAWPHKAWWPALTCFSSLITHLSLPDTWKLISWLLGNTRVLLSLGFAQNASLPVMHFPPSLGLMVTLQPDPQASFDFGDRMSSLFPTIKTPSILKDPAQSRFLRESSHYYALHSGPPLRSLSLHVLDPVLPLCHSRIPWFSQRPRWRPAGFLLSLVFHSTCPFLA